MDRIKTMTRKERTLWTLLTLGAMALSMAMCFLFSENVIHSHTQSVAHEQSHYESHTSSGLEFDYSAPSQELQSRTRPKVNPVRISPQDAPTYANTSSAICKSEILYSQRTRDSIRNPKPRIKWLMAKRTMLYPFHSFL